jgi:hypothetical protein
MHTNYCLYYTAKIDKKRCWLLSSILRANEHIAFDRSLDPQASIFEFFVPHGMEQRFLTIMNYMEQKAVVTDLVKLPNRRIPEKK